MKRTWIWGLCVSGFCAIGITGSAIAIAQQEGSASPITPPSPPVAAVSGAAPVQDLAPSTTTASTAPVAPIDLAAPATATTSSDPFGGGQAGVAKSSNDPNSSRPAITTGPAAQASSGITRASGATISSASPAQQGSANPFGATSGSAPRGMTTGRSGGLGGQASGFGGRGGGGIGGTFTGSGFGGNMSFGGGPNLPASKEVQAFHEAEQKVNQLAGQARSFPADHENAIKAKEELKAAVTAAFEARQAMQQAEVKRLKDKLAEIEAHVKRRADAKDVLIAERVFELTSGSGGGFPSSMIFPSPNSFPSGSSGWIDDNAVPARAQNAPASTIPAQEPGEPTVPKTR